MKRYNVQAEKALLKQNENDNFPKGAIETSHQFRKDVKLRTNEEMYILSDDEILGPGPTITPAHELLNAKCCRLVFHLPKEKLAKIYRVHGEGIAYFCGTDGFDPDFNIPHCPDYGFDMTDRDNGFPCVNLLPNGNCQLHQAHEDLTIFSHPAACKRFPQVPEVISLINTCSYTFDINGNRSGTCNQCKGP